MDEIISNLVDNLGHSLESVRVRALHSIITKLDLELISVDSLIAHPKLLYHLINWLKLGSPFVEEILKLILLLSKKKDGLELLLHYDPDLATLSKTLTPSDFHTLQTLRDSIRLDSIEPVKDSESSSVITSIKSTTCTSSKNVASKKKKSKRCSHRQTSSSSQSVSASSLEWDSSLKLPKNDTISAEHPVEARSSCQPVQNSFQLSSILPESDVKVLKTVCSSLRDSEQCKEAVNFLSTVAFQDFPPQVFLLETSILQSLLKVAENKLALKKLVVTCLGELTLSLLRYYHSCHDARANPGATLMKATGGFTLEDFCGLLLDRIGPDVPGLSRLLMCCVPDTEAFWKATDNKYLILKHGIKTVLSRFASDILNEKTIDYLKRLHAQIGLFRLISCIIPASLSSVISPDVQTAIQQSLFDPVLSILYPRVLGFFRSYSKTFKAQSRVSIDDYFFISESLVAGAVFLKSSEWASFDDFLSCFTSALPGFEFHQKYDMIQSFVNHVLKEKNASTIQIQNVRNISIKLFSSVDINVRRAIYESTSKAITTYLGPHNSVESDPFPSLYFAFDKSVLWEMVMYGACSEDSAIRESSQNALILIIKSQMIVTPSAWKEIVVAIACVFPLLHCLTDMNTNLGRCVVSSLDPDVAKEMSLTDLDILKGNVRLMMSSDECAKKEGTIRVAYLLDIQPHRRGYQSFNLLFEPSKGLSAPPANYEEGSLLRVLEVMKLAVDDVTMLKSAVTQLSLMIEDPSLHILFLDNRGLDLTKDYLKSSIESPNSDSSHFFKHSVIILRNVAESCEQVRRECSCDLSLITFILKGVFLYDEDWCVLRDSTQLLFLIVFNELIEFKDRKIRFPSPLLKNLKLPYHCLPYRGVSENLQPSYAGMLKTPVVSRSLGLQWCALSFSGGVDGLLLANEAALSDFPALLPVSNKDLTVLKMSSIRHNLLLHLENLYSAFSHTVAEDAVNELNCYLRLADCTDDCQELCSLPWEKNFKRYLTTLPASGRDQVLLIQILRFLRVLLVVLPNQSIWISKIVKHPSYGFNSLLAQVLAPDMSDTEKQLSLEVLSLVELCLRNSDSSEEWDFVVSCLVQSLSQSHTQQFYSIAITGKLLKCLLEASEKKILFKTKSLWKLLNAFHCPTPNSCMGITITRLSLLCLSNLLPLHSKLSEIVKSATEIKWLWELLSSRDVVIKSAALELLGYLCHDSVSTEQILSLSSSSVWKTSISILLDEKEPNLTRERAADICNVIITKSANKALVNSCVESGLFKSVSTIATRGQLPSASSEQFQNPSEGSLAGDSKLPATPLLVTSCCNLCLNLISRDKEKALEGLHSQGLVPQLFGLVSRWQTNRPLRTQEIVDMYTSICRLLVHCVGSSTCQAVDCVPVMVWLLQDSTYDNDVNKVELVANSIALLSSIASLHKDEKVLFTKEAVKTICQALTSSCPEVVAAFSTALPPLTRFLDADACATIVSNLGAYNPQHRLLLSGILGSSNAGTLKALETGLMPPLIQNLRQTVVNLSLIPLDAPRTKKTNLTLNNLSVDLGLMTNFLAGSSEAKELATSHGLADVLHKLWAWCLLDSDLLCSLLQVLVTLTSNCSSASSSLVMTSNLIGVSQRKTSTSNSILHAALALLSKEAYDTPVKVRILELAANACQATESRAVLVKFGIVNEFIKFCQLKWCLIVAELEAFWLQFMVTFTYYAEGQAMMKNDELFSQLNNLMSSGRTSVKPLVTAIFRNLTFFHKNRQKLIVCEKWLKMLSNRALEISAPGNGDELRDLSLIAWYLIANSQRGKCAVHNAGLDKRLMLASSSLPSGHPTLEILATVRRILNPHSES